MLNEQNHSAQADDTEFDWDAYITPTEQAEEVEADLYNDWQ